MSTLHGSRFLGSLGRHGYTNVLYQQRFASIGVTLQCKFLLKKKGVNHSPFFLNKCDVSNCQFLLPAFSTLSASQLLAYHSSDLRKFPEILLKRGIVSQNPKNVDGFDESQEIHVRIDDIEFDDEAYLGDAMSKFGDVARVFISKKSRKVELNRFKFAIVSFSNKSSAEMAVKEKSVTTSDGMVFPIRRRTVASQAKKPVTTNESLRTYVVRGLPENVDAFHLYDYFSSMGEVAMTYIYFSYSKGYMNSNAVILLKKERDSITFRDHKVRGNRLFVEKAFTDYIITPKSKSKCYTVLLEGLPDGITEHQIRYYFGDFGEIFKVNLIYDKGTGEREDRAFISYVNSESAQDVALAGSHEVHGSSVTARLLGYLKDGDRE